MRVLWLGDAVVSSGFARCTHKVCDYLHAQGHEVHVLGINYHGDPHPHRYPIYPARHPFDGGNDLFGVGRLPLMIHRLRPDVVVILQDPWNIQYYFAELDKYSWPFPLPPIIGYLAVDSRNQNGIPLNRLAHVITWTQFAVDELQSGGYTGSTSIAPLGVDTTLYRPHDRTESRAWLMSSCAGDPLPDDAFLVGYVGRNQPRKRLDLTLEYFAEWVHTCGVDNAYLYLHVAPTGDIGCDIQSLARYYGIHGRVLVGTPDLGHGIAESHMPLVYSAMDVFLTTTQGEGFCLPVLEALACGVRCIVPSFAAFGNKGWIDQVSVKTVPCTTSAITALTVGGSGGVAYSSCTVGALPDKEETVRALNETHLYRKLDLSEQLRKAGLRLASHMTWEKTGEEVLCALIAVVAVDDPDKWPTCLSCGAKLDYDAAHGDLWCAVCASEEVPA